MKQVQGMLIAAAIVGVLAAEAGAAPARSAEQSSRIRTGSTRTSARPVVHGASRPAGAVRSVEDLVGPPAPAADAPGMVIGIDPQTGAVGMPSPEQMARLAVPRGTVPAVVHHANGSVSLDCRGWMRQNFMVAIGADGKPIPQCVDGPEQVARVMRQPPTVRPGQEVK